MGLSELKEGLETPEEAGISIMQIAKQARSERGQKLFETFRQGENEVYIASAVRWDTQLKGLVELERRCQEMMQEVKLLSDRQEVLSGVVVSKRDLRKEAAKTYQEKAFEEFKELEEQRAKEALELVQKKHMLVKWEGEKGKSGNVAKIVRIESDTTLE